MKKRIEKIDDHFTIRGWFDIYCSQGESSTPYFKKLERKHRFFKVYETGWCKVDSFFKRSSGEQPRKRPVVLYAPTFTKGISSAWELLPELRRLTAEKPWDWIITFHPKLNDSKLIADYQLLADERRNVVFSRVNDGLPTFLKSDVMLCDSSSIIVEYMMLDKPVVTFRNTHPGDFLIDVTESGKIGDAIENALTKPAGLMENIHRYTSYHEPHRDGLNSARVLDAVDDFVANYQGRLRKKPMNLFRKLKLRWKLKYFHWR